MEITVIILYTLCLACILAYSLMQAQLIWSYRKFHKEHNPGKEVPEIKEYPFVTVQLPIYNELYVVERLLDATAKLDYPKDKFEIQVLDDSTDETIQIIAKKVKEFQEKGIPIEHVRRDTRTGFKAGALAYGITIAKGEFFAIFDADFLPNPDFLKKLLPHFQDEKIGMVQSKWGHLNLNYSMLTRMQAFGLDGHFTVEQKGRDAIGVFLNFNGTAGVWRKSCIIDAGGWQHDTLTEDLDLSYRAQLKGWKLLYREDVSTPAEIPATMDALRSQQYRWNKGAAENARKNMLGVLKSKLSIFKKLHAVFHLLNTAIFICVFGTAFFSLPILYICAKTSYGSYLDYHGIFFLSGAILSFFYWNASAYRYKNAWETTYMFIRQFPIFLSMSIGISLHNAIAVIEGYMGKKTPFVRTPKFNIVSDKDTWNTNVYLNGKLNGFAYLEGFLSLYSFTGLILSIYWGFYGSSLFFLLLTFGFGTIFYYSLAHTRVLKPV